MLILRPRPSSKLPIDAEARPLPSDDTTPPVTKINLVCFELARAGADTVMGLLVASAVDAEKRLSSTRAHILSFSSSEVNARRHHPHHRRRPTDRRPLRRGAE